MNLKNGYKTLFEVIEGDNRVFYASKTGFFTDKEPIASYPVKSVKIVYQGTDNKLYGVNKDGTDLDLAAINALFIEQPTKLPDEEGTGDDLDQTEEPKAEPEADPEEELPGSDEEEE